MIKLIEIDKRTEERKEIYSCKYDTEIPALFLGYIKFQVLPEQAYYKIYPEKLEEYKQQFKNRSNFAVSPTSSHHELCIKSAYRLIEDRKVDIAIIQFRYELEGENEIYDFKNTKTKFLKWK